MKDKTKVTYYQDAKTKKGGKVTREWIPVLGAENVKQHLKDKGVTYDSIVIH